MDVRCVKSGWLIVGVMAWWAATAAAATNTTSLAGADGARDEADWSRHVVQVYQDYQAQQQVTLRAIEQARQDAAAATAAAKRNAEENEARLRRIEDAIGAQHERELATLQSAQRFTLITVGILAGGGFFGMLIFAIFLLRSMNRRVEVCAAQPFAGGHPLGAGYAAALGTGDAQLLTLNPAEQSNARLLSALESLEQRIRGMENPAGSAAPPAEEGSSLPVAAPGAPAGEPSAKEDNQARIALLLGKGQALLNLQQADTALACFDEVIAADPTMAEAFVKKGTALERLGRIDEAIDNYDRAIALDDSSTMAYLCKGGVFNRLERYGEALQCYEQALRTQDKIRVG